MQDTLGTMILARAKGMAYPVNTLIGWLEVMQNFLRNRQKLSLFYCFLSLDQT